MKISSASKKVLASALSAAMVVAFAPTVAFGKTVSPSGTPAADGSKIVDVTYDANGGTLKGNAGETVQLTTDANGKYFIKVNPGADPTMSSGYAFKTWFIDADGDGLYNTNTEIEIDSNSYVEVAADTTAVTLKAAYTMPDATFGNYGKKTGYTVGSVTDDEAMKLPITVAAGMLQEGHTYILKVTCPDGTSSEVKTYGSAAGQTAITSTINASGDIVEVIFSKMAVSSEKNAFLADHLTSGEYVAELIDNGKVISTTKTKLVQATVKVGDSSKSALGQIGSSPKVASVDLAAINTLRGTTYDGYVDAEGYSAGTYTKNTAPTADTCVVNITADSVFTATKVKQNVSNVVYAPDTTPGVHGALKFDLANDSNNKYAVTVTDPSGAVVFTGSYDGASVGTETVSFDTAAGTSARTSAPEQAGVYVVTVETTDQTTKDVTTSKAKMTLTEIKYAVGEGVEFKTGYTKADAQHTFSSNATFVEGTDYASATTVAAKKDTNAGNPTWELNGKAYNSTTNPIKAGEVNTLTAVSKAASYGEVPTYTVVEKVAGTKKQYVMTVTPAAGTTIEYNEATAITSGTITWSPSNTALSGAIIMDSTVPAVKLVVKASGKTNKEIVLMNATGATETWKGVVSGAASKLELNIGNTGSKWLAADGVASAIASGKAAVDAVAAKYFAGQTEIDAAFLAGEKALYEAVAAEAQAQIAKYADGADVVAGSKVYYMTTTQYKDATDTLAADAKKAENSLKGLTDDATKAAAYVTAMNDVIAHTNDSLKDGVTENKTIKAADITAAAAVTDQLKAAKTVAEAEAALAAYAALNDEAKKLVATADVTAAEAIVAEAKAAAELKDAQDDAAVSKARNTSKTVKAGKNGKTTKKQSVTLKKITSASGAKVTYKKTSGSSKVSVKSGKAYLAKGVKKGTYKASVKATCGTQTAKITVKFVVK